MSGEDWPGENWSPDRADIHELIADGEIEACELLQNGSNYVFVLRLNTAAAGQGLAIYKPMRGEAPLWDYPAGLYKREVATYLVSQAIGWGIVPPTIVRDGPHGVGSAQLYIEHNPRITFFELRADRADEMRRMAVFDALVNNGDRKGGHCLLGPDGRIWGIDHGLSFHPETKLRTVIWDYAGEEIPEDLIRDLRELQGCLNGQSELVTSLRSLITREEIGALRQRLDVLIKKAQFPSSGYRRSVPWPPV